MNFDILDKAIEEYEKKNPTMNIWTAKGEKVIFVGENGHDHEKDHAMKYLEIGKEYTVEKLSVNGWSSDVYLQEIENKSFNSVMFANVSENPIEVQNKNEY